MPTLILKTEPDDYSWDDLVREKKTTWDGVANNAALMHMRDAKKGDEALIYHTGKEKRIVGLAQLVSRPRTDPNDPDGRLTVFDIKAVRAAKTPVTLADIKADDRFADFALVRQPRLGVIPTPPALDKALRKMAGL